MPDSRIFLANDRMGIVDAANFIGMDVSSGDFQLAKHFCPFGAVFHSDGGASRAFKFYPDTNSAWCFAGCGYFNPVKIIAMDRSITEPEAAEVILTETGYVEPTVEARWEAATAVVDTVDTDYLTEALKTYCARIEPDWVSRQFDPEVSTVLRKCLELSTLATTSAAAAEWLSKTKTVMHRVLKGQTDD